MNIVKKILLKCNGMHYSREYICFPEGKHIYPIQLLLKNNDVTIDITTHLMIGINPLIIALPGIKEIDLTNIQDIQIDYVQPTLKNDSTLLAKMQLKKISQEKLNASAIFFFEAINGSHRFISKFYQTINRFYNNIYNKTGNNIFLNNNLYNLIQIVYSTPKIIALITVGQQHTFNLFPTDQHGQINNEHYIITLRSAGKACDQVKSTKRIAISNVKAEYYKEVYALGKNHMQPMREKHSIDFSDTETQTFKLPLPENATDYKELDLVIFFEYGIHTIFLFRILNAEIISDKAKKLVCINNAYATWRFKHNLPCDYFLP